jgi:hypothetical protein
VRLPWQRRSTRIIVRAPFQLDERGRRELSELLTDTRQRAEVIQRRSQARTNGRGPATSVIPSELAILHVRMPDPQTGARPSPTATTREALP